MKEKIKKNAAEFNIDCCGVAQQDGKSIIVCLFPYYINYEKGNISRYAVLKDYHIVVKSYLEKIAKKVGLKNYKTYTDTSPYNEKKLALNAGLGVIGKNGLLINEKYGSYVFIGIIVLEDLILVPDKPLNLGCLNCDKCINLCPGKAISTCGFLKENCLSDITQKKSDLTETEKSLIKKTGIVWGCDICSEVCPMNKNIAETPFPEFKEDIIPSISADDLSGLSNKEFAEKFGDRAFSWRGKNVLIRNCRIIEE